VAVIVAGLLIVMSMLTVMARAVLGDATKMAHAVQIMQSDEARFMSSLLDGHLPDAEGSRAARIGPL
jgi:hypothetical protein